MITLAKSPVIFREEDHTYWLGDKQLQGITSTLIHRAFPEKYNDVAPEVLAAAAEKGKQLHQLIEYHDNFGTSADEHEDPRVAHYEEVKRNNGLHTVANEYLVSDEQHYASSIDIVMASNDDEIYLVDIKTTWTLDNLSVALQLSIYKRLFERQNPHLKVSGIYVLWLPNKDLSICQFNSLREVDDDVIDSLIKADKDNIPFDISIAYGTLPEKVADVEDEIVRIEDSLKALKETEDMLKEGLYSLMEKEDVKSFTGTRIRLTRVLPTTSETFDAKRFKEEHPDLYKTYTKQSQRSGSLKISILKS